MTPQKPYDIVRRAINVYDAASPLPSNEPPALARCTDERSDTPIESTTITSRFRAGPSSSQVQTP